MAELNGVGAGGVNPGLLGLNSAMGKLESGQGANIKASYSSSQLVSIGPLHVSKMMFNMPDINVLGIHRKGGPLLDLRSQHDKDVEQVPTQMEAAIDQMLKAMNAISNTNWAAPGADEGNVVLQHG